MEILVVRSIKKNVFEQKATSQQLKTDENIKRDWVYLPALQSQ